MDDNLFLFHGIGPPSSVTFTLMEVLQAGTGLIISVNKSEDEYFRGMQLIMGGCEIITFQEFHDKAWVNATNRHQNEYQSLRDFLDREMFCSSRQFGDYMYTRTGDHQMERQQRGKLHWSQAEKQTSFFMGDFIL